MTTAPPAAPDQPTPDPDGETDPDGEAGRSVLHGQLIPAARPASATIKPTAPTASADPAQPGPPDLTAYLHDHAPADGGGAAYLAALAADIAGYLQAAHAPSTGDKYRHGWAEFRGFCARFDLEVGVPTRATEVEVVALYLAELGRAGVAMSTVDQRLAAIRYVHADAQLPTPTDHPWIKRIRRGMRRTHGVHTTGKDAVSIALLIAMIRARPVPATPHPAARAAVRRAHLIALRDRCLLLLGFFAGVRRSEFTRIHVDDLELLEPGLRIHLGRSKTDQEGVGRVIDVPYAPAELAWLCPVRATMAWLQATGRRLHLRQGRRPRTDQTPTVPPLLSGITGGANIRATPLAERYVAQVVKDTATAAGQPPEVVEQLAAHSLRAGIATAARAAGVDEARVGRLLGHAGTMTSRYDRPTWSPELHEAVYAWIFTHPALAVTR